MSEPHEDGGESDCANSHPKAVTPVTLVSVLSKKHLGMKTDVREFTESTVTWRFPLLFGVSSGDGRYVKRLAPHLALFSFGRCPEFINGTIQEQIPAGR